MKSSSTLSRALFATVLLLTIMQNQPLQANPLWPPSGSYELTARLELPHLERWGVDKSTIICLSDSRAGDEVPVPVVSANNPFAVIGEIAQEPVPTTRGEDRSIPFELSLHFGEVRTERAHRVVVCGCAKAFFKGAAII